MYRSWLRRILRPRMRRSLRRFQCLPRGAPPPRFNWYPPRILTIKLDQIERDHNRILAVALSANKVEHGQSVIVRDNRFAVDQERAPGQRCDRCGDERKARREIVALPRDQPNTGTIAPGMMRMPSCFISCSHPSPEGGRSAGDGRQGRILPSGRRLRTRNMRRVIRPQNWEVEPFGSGSDVELATRHRIGLKLFPAFKPSLRFGSSCSEPSAFSRMHRRPTRISTTMRCAHPKSCR